MKEICKDDCEDKTDVHMKTIDLVFSDETIEAEKTSCSFNKRNG